MILARDPYTSPFNEWLTKNGIYLAVGVAALIIIIVVTLLFMSKRKKH